MQPNVLSKKLSFSALLRALKRYKLFLLIPVLLLTPAIALYTIRIPQRFRARALVGADTAMSGRSAFSSPDTLVTLNAQDQLRVIRETVLSTPVLERVIRQFNLYDLPPGRAPAPMIEKMTERIEVQLEGPETFYVGFEDSQPALAMQVANRLAGLFLERKSDLRGRLVQREDSLLNSEVWRLQAQLAQQEDRLKVYKQDAADELPERLTANLKQLETLQQQIQAKTDQITEGEARKAALSEEVNALASQGVLEPEPVAKTSTEVTLEQLRLKLNELKTKYTPEHPEILRAQKQIHDLEAIKTSAPVTHRPPTPAQLRYVELQSELKSIDPRLQSYRNERAALISDMQMYELRINASPALETALTDHVKDAALTRARYESLLAKQQEAKLSHRAEESQGDLAYRIIEPAQLPVTPYSPHRLRIMLAGFLGSLGIGLLAAFLAHRSNSSFETTEELEQFTKLPVLTGIPGIPIASKGAQPPRLRSAGFTPEQSAHFQQYRLAPLTDPQSVASQQYSILALKIQQWMAQTGGKTLLVTSSSGAEGKSLTALNLSLALAESSENRVLLVDGDTRLPCVHRQLGLKQEPGFSDLLAHHGGDPEQYISQYISKIGALSVITGGSEPANPVGLIASPQARAILTILRDRYQLVVLDSPPIVPIADSQILAGLCDGVLLVVRARQTSPELLLRAITSLGASSVVGIVLNDVELAATPYAYAYRYYQKNCVGRS
jgi:polysaccharide biosynthesis transport protein